MTTGLIVAMQSEFDLTARILQQPIERKIKHLNFIEGTLNGERIVLMRSGIGKVNAAAAAVEMINVFAPEAVINTGIAGGIDPSLSVMDVVLGSETVYHDVWCGEGNVYGQIQDCPPRFAGDKTLLDKAAALQTDTTLRRGLIASGDRFISDAAELKAIKDKFPEALAVDMESAAIAQICHLYKTPYLAVRIISDTPGIENHYQQYQDFWKQAPEKSLNIIRQMIG